MAFVSTNSIVQGEQVAQLWPILFRMGLEIAFAHRTFAWGSDARGKAHVHVVIIGFTHRDDAPAEKRLFSYDHVGGEPDETRHAALTAYLFDAGSVANRHLVVREEARPINGAAKLVSGSQPIDGGHYIFTKAERQTFLEKEPDAELLLRRYIGADDFINGGERWILTPQEIAPSVLRTMPFVRERIKAVRVFRTDSARKGTLAIANSPHRFNVEVFPTSHYLVFPEVSSERRPYIPLGWLEGGTVPSNLVRILVDASL